MDLRELLKNNFLTKDLYAFLRSKKRQYVFNSKIKTKYKFVNRSKAQKKLCIVLAGYKEFAYNIFFERIKKFSPSDIDFCIISSGKYCEVLEKICEENNWSYLSTERNNVCVAQNLAIHLHPDAEYIYKLDEDIFITENYFETAFETLQRVTEDSDYAVGFVAPLILINGYSTLRILKKLNLREEYEKRFERLYHAHGNDRMIENNPDVAEFMWGKDGIVPHIDEINRFFQSEEFSYSVCPIRFSIGAILFKREVFEEIGMFSVYKKGNGLGDDELQFCNITMELSKAIIVAENSVVGHLSFGKQNSTMKEYFLNHPEKFDFAK